MAKKYRAPSMKALKEAFPYTEDATLLTVRQLIRGEAKPSKVSPKTLEASKLGYFQLGTFDALLHAIDAVLEHHGIEATLDDEGRAIAEYSNAGDTYAPTIIYVTSTDTFRLTTWGDFVETWERKHARLH